MKGVVKWFGNERGEGYIHAAGRDYSFGVTDVKGDRIPERGQRVEFTPRAEADGQLSASDVIVLFGTSSVQIEASSAKNVAPSFKIEYSTDYQQVEANRRATALGCSAILLVPGFLFSLYYFDSWWAIVFWTVLAAIVGGSLGASFPQEEIKRETRKYVRTPTCLKCGGVGDVVAARGNRFGFRCLECGHHWTARKGSVL